MMSVKIYGVIVKMTWLWFTPSVAVIAVSPGSEAGTMNVTTNIPLESVCAVGISSNASPSLVIVILCDAIKLNPSIDIAFPGEPLDWERKTSGDTLKNDADAFPEASSVTVMM